MILAAFALLLGGVLFAAFVEPLIASAVAGSPRPPLTAPLHRAALALVQQSIRTEHPDRLNWILAPAVYLTLAAAGLSVVPLMPGMVVADLDSGIVLWGSCEVLTVVIVFLHGWSANAPLPLIGAYRYVAIGLPVMLVSMFVLIGVALPAQSLSVAAIVESQHALINGLRQPLGLPLFLLLGLSLTLRGPFDYGDSEDLAGGTAAEVSGNAWLAWHVAKLAMLVSFSVMAASLFLGGYLGPLLPGLLWLVLKSACVLLALITIGRIFARMPPARMLTLLWTVLLPLSFMDLLQAGLVAMQ